MNIGSHFVATAVHGGDHFIYPDCRPAFVDALSMAMSLAADDLFTEGAFEGIYSPFITTDKAYIAALGHAMHVDWNDTWSCYKGGEIHCGRCGTCVERREAFMLSGVEDPTLYEDYDFAWEAIAKHKRGEQ